MKIFGRKWPEGKFFFSLLEVSLNIQTHLFHSLPQRCVRVILKTFFKAPNDNEDYTATTADCLSPFFQRICE